MKIKNLLIVGSILTLCLGTSAFAKKHGHSSSRPEPHHNITLAERALAQKKAENGFKVSIANLGVSISNARLKTRRDEAAQTTRNVAKAQSALDTAIQAEALAIVAKNKAAERLKNASSSDLVAANAESIRAEADLTTKQGIREAKRQAFEEAKSKEDQANNLVSEAQDLLARDKAFQAKANALPH